ncbi:MAG TPA: GlsB/YeaQ/YmgE family stress response membrane protein [Chloroflexota bacterium]|nr:GlsB/YeaQ/YmgE family stress response membrane protein [Chloroflexota bacterium]
MVLDPGGVIAWVIVGLIAGWLASVLVRGSGMGLIGDIVVGIIGAIIGGWVLTAFGIRGMEGFWGSILVALLGAVILLALIRLLIPRPRRL